MTTTVALFLGAAYFIALIAFGLYTATLRLWLPYAGGTILFVVAFYTGMFWSAVDEGGPSGFAVIAAHGLVFWVVFIAHAVRWLRVWVARLRAR
jgi:hypothetical protein